MRPTSLHEAALGDRVAGGGCVRAGGNAGAGGAAVKRVPPRPPADPGPIEVIKRGLPPRLRLDVSADCRLSNYVEDTSLNVYCWMHQPTCPNGRPVLLGFRRWWIWNDGGSMVAIALIFLAALVFAVAMVQTFGVRP